MNSKTLSYIDVDTNRYCTYQCSLKESIKDKQLNEFYNSLYDMNLDSNTGDTKIFKEGKTTIDLINEFNQIVNSEVINFDNFFKLFSSERILTIDTIKDSINKFLMMFDFNILKSFSRRELDVIIRATLIGSLQKSESFKKTKEEIKSINSNSKLINKIGYKPEIKRNKVLVR